jgi:hypothetical protein
VSALAGDSSQQAELEQMKRRERERTAEWRETPVLRMYKLRGSLFQSKSRGPSASQNFIFLRQGLTR